MSRACGFLSWFGCPTRRPLFASTLGRLAIAAALGLVVAAALTGSRSAATPGPASSGGAQAITVAVTIRDERCTLSQKSVPVGTVVFRVVNRGRLVHAFRAGPSRTRSVRPGGKATLSVAFPNSGRIAYACTGPGAHVLRGTLLVTPATPRVEPTPERPCGVTGSSSRYTHIVWIVMENKRYDQVIGSSSAPYINDLARRCGTASNFFAEAHPSLPNYIAMTSGDTQGIKDDSGPSSHQLQVSSIFSQLGGDWRALQESMPSNCSPGNSSLYVVRHNPAAYYANIRSQCATQNVPLGGAPDLSARFTFITPNTCNDMHSCPGASDSAAQIRNGDTWLSTWMPKILDSREYRSGSTVVFLTWDEDDYSSANKQHIATLVVAPSTPAGTVVADRFDHYSLLRTTEELLGLGLLGNASSAASMRAAFHL